MAAEATQELLTDLDNKKFGWFHVKVILISGAGFFTDAYDLFSISLLTALLGRLYYQDNPFVLNTTVSPGKLPLNINICLSVVALVGTLCGQVVIGVFGDKAGRKASYGLALSIMIICAFCQASIKYFYCLGFFLTKKLNLVDVFWYNF
jgi:PHS family inorganic phosphate transporter-like MFS transporter